MRSAPHHMLGILRMRSEEHTSELQSRLHLVCRLLLEKKKNASMTPPAACCKDVKKQFCVGHGSTAVDVVAVAVVTVDRKSCAIVDTDTRLFCDVVCATASHTLLMLASIHTLEPTPLTHTGTTPLLHPNIPPHHHHFPQTALFIFIPPPPFLYILFFFFK